MAKHPQGRAERPTTVKRARIKASPAVTDATETPTGNDAAGVSAMPIVGIGASAGGLEALGSFFDTMPTDSGCAFVVVLHLDPKRESEMAHILATRTAMPVAQVEDGMRITANHVYVIAPDTDLCGRTRERSRWSRGQRPGRALS